MKACILSLMIWSLTSSAWAAGNICVDIFQTQTTKVAKEDTEPKPAPPMPPISERQPGVPVYSYGKRMTAEQIADAIEAGPVLTKVNRLSDAEMETLIQQTRDLLGDRTITAGNVRDALYAAKNKYKDQLDDRMKAFGQGISASVRDMRKRRLQFAFIIKAGDPIAASSVYRDLFESYYISKSRILEYIGGKKSTRDQYMIENSRFILKGITVSMFPDLNRQVDRIYKNGRTPSIDEVMSVYDQIYARTNDEFRYFEFYIRETLADPTVDAAVKSNIDYVLRRLSVETMAARVGISMLRQAYLDSPQANHAIEYNRPQIIVYGLKYALRGQRWFNFTFALSAFTQNVALQLTKHIKPAGLRDAVRGLMMLNYNIYVLKMYLIPMEAVITAPVGKRGPIFEGFLDNTMNTDYSAQFMETLARLSSDRAVWKELKSYVEEKAGDDPTYKIMLDQMVEAEQGIAKYGWISRYHETSAFDIWLGIGIRGTPVAVTLGTMYWDQIVTGFTNTMIWASSVAESGWAQLMGFF